MAKPALIEFQDFSFQYYSQAEPTLHDINLKIFREFCDKWGIEVSAEGAVELIRFFEGFTCAP